MLTANNNNQAFLPTGFVNLNEVCDKIEYDIIFATPRNFVGRVIDGYHNHKVLLTKEAADALYKVQLELEKIGYCLKIYDAYRPVKAVNCFLEWKFAPDDLTLKKKYYPSMNKMDLFKKGYIASNKSSHSRGSTVDLTIINAETRIEIDMGSALGHFSDVATTHYHYLPLSVKKNRRLLLESMEKNGFKNLENEWWHFTLKNEPFPDVYFDFDII